MPYSGYGCGSLPTADLLRGCSRQLRSTHVVNADFEKVLKHAEKGDLIYMDPPYAVQAVRVFREYNASTFTHSDISRLRGWMERLHKAGVSFIVSYAESDEADILKKNFAYETIAVRRNIAGFAAHRAWTNEILISNT